MLKEELNMTGQDLAQFETRSEDLEHDVDALVNLIGNARATGKWEVRCVNIIYPLLDMIFRA